MCAWIYCMYMVICMFLFCFFGLCIILYLSMGFIVHLMLWILCILVSLYFILDYFYFYQVGFTFHLILHRCWSQWLIGLRKKIAGCVFNSHSTTKGGFFPGQRWVMPDTDKSHSEVKPVGRCSGLSWKRLNLVTQDCVCWEKGVSDMLIASET